MKKENTMTPMMQQYMKTKEEYKDCILFYRLGDFYEMFFEDALTASKELEITLTGKNCGMEERAPMCGVPFHAVDSYLNKLVSRGYKVAICEQVEDPKLAKGIVKREVVRVVTPGTNTDIQALDESRNNYIMCIVYLDDRYGIAIADVSTGDYFVTELSDSTRLKDELFKFMPTEIICNEAFYMSGMDMEDLRERLGITISALDSWYFDDDLCKNKLTEHFHVANMQALGLEDFNCGVHQCRGTSDLPVRDTEKFSGTSDPYSGLYYRGLYVARQFYPTESGTLRNTARETKTRVSSLGTG